MDSFNDFVTLVIGLLAVSSVTLVWVKGEIFDPFKKYCIGSVKRFDAFLSTLLYCSMCSGFWVGIFSYVFIQPYILGKPWWMELPLWACMVSITSIALDKAIWKKPVANNNMSDIKLRS